MPVPGLVDLATPAFSEVGKVGAQHTAFWYRRTFRIDLRALRYEPHFEEYVKGSVAPVGLLLDHWPTP